MTNVSGLPKVSTERLSQLAGGKNEKKELLFKGSPQIKTTVYSQGDLLKAPLSGTPCAYYEVKAYSQTPEANYHIGTYSSETPFYVLIKDTLVESGIVHADFEPTLRKTYKSGDEPEEIEGGMTILGWLDTARSYPEYTVEEWVFVPDHSYTLTIEELGYAFPSEKSGGEVTYGYGYHFHFK